MSGIGHNRGPSMEPGHGFRRYAWGKAREALLPTLPIEVVRTRVRRAAELGIDYKSYAGFRATTGRDIVAFLFSSNALRVEPRVLTLPADRAARLAAIRACGRLAMVQPPLDPQTVVIANMPLIEAAGRAPGLMDSWRDMRRRIEDITVARGLPRDGIVVVGETALERDWSVAARLAGFLPAERYFGKAAE